jgi:hypothetical protein
MSTPKSIITPNDFGPAAVPRSRITRNGLGARMIYRGNPFSFFTDVLGPCIPFLSLAGGQDAASKAVRAGRLGDPSEGGGGGTGSTGGAATAGTTPDTAGEHGFPVTTGGTETAPVDSQANSNGKKGTNSSGGLFNSIRAVDSKRTT